MWGAEAVIDSTVQAFFALVLAWMLYRGERKPWMLALALLPMMMDMDHLLPTYADGIKAFHSMFFVYLISGTLLIYGYIRDSNTARKLGISSFAILIFAISMDLMEGGKVSFAYPLSSQAFALPYFGAYQASKIALISLMISLIFGVYLYERSLEKGSDEPHRSSRITFTDLRDRTVYGIESTIRTSNIGSESVFRLTALLASFLILYSSLLIMISR